MGDSEHILLGPSCDCGNDECWGSKVICDEYWHQVHGAALPRLVARFGIEVVEAMVDAVVEAPWSISARTFKNLVALERELVRGEN